jgi:hypothetical protein
LGRLNFERAPPTQASKSHQVQRNEREKAQEGKEGGRGGGAQRQYVKNKFRCSLNFWAEASANQKSNLCIGQPKFFFGGGIVKLIQAVHILNLDLAI